MTLLEATLNEIRPIDPHWIEAARQRQLELTKPPGSLGRLEDLANRCAAIAIRDEQWQAALKTLTAGDASQIIVEACVRHDVTPEELLAELSQCTFDY